MKFFSRSVLVVGVSLSLLSIAYASKARLPSVNSQTIRGVWEAVGDENISVYRLEVRNERDGELTQVMYVGAVPASASRYKISQIVFMDDSFVIEMVGEHTGRTLLRGSGNVGRSDGVVNGLLVAELVFGPDTASPHSIGLKFFMSEKPYVQMLADLEKVARNAARGANKK